MNVQVLIGFMDFMMNARGDIVLNYEESFPTAFSTSPLLA